MDLISKLNSLLSPGPNPANHSTRPASAAAAQKRAAATQTFAQTLAGLADPTILPFGVQPVPGTKAVAPAGPTVTPTGGPAVIINPAGPTILPGIPPDRPTGPGSKDTLDEVLAGGKPTEPTGPTSSEPREIVPTGSTAATAPAAAPAAPVSLLPPLGVLWSGRVLRGSGASGPGVGGSDAQAAQMLVEKHALYSDPARQGVSLNQEGRLFLDAVSRGYVPNSPEGLGTVLSYLSMGSFADGPNPARPAAFTAYFNQFYAAERATGIA